MDVDIPDRLRSLLIYAFGLLEVSLVVAVATPLAVMAILPMLILYAGFQVRRDWVGHLGPAGVTSASPRLWAGVSVRGSVQLGVREPP